MGIDKYIARSFRITNAGCSTVIFLAIIFLHFSEPILDRQISQWLAKWMNNSSMSVFGFVSDLGDLRLIVPLTFGILVFLLWKRGWNNALGLFFCVFIGGVVSSLLKYIFRQPRIDYVQSDVFEMDFGFPSGHTIMAILFYGFLAYLLIKSTRNQILQWSILVSAGVIVFLVGLSRLLIGVHLLSDVLGGWVIGLVWLIVSIIVNQKTWALVNTSRCKENG